MTHPLHRFPGLPTAILLLSLPLFIPAPAVAARDAAARIERIEKLLGEVRGELDSLKRESRDLEEQTRHTGEDPILGDLMSDRQRRLAKATRTEFRRVAAGYSFNAALPMGLHALHWFDPWGFKLEGGAIITDDTRMAGLNVTGLYSIHRFNAAELLETHLYGFAGAGFLWERVLFASHIARPWYETPDRRLTGKLGVGSEVSFFNLGGVRFAPEVGLQLDRYLTRHEDSPSYTFEIPESRTFLGPFFAFHISFYLH